MLYQFEVIEKTNKKKKPMKKKAEEPKRMSTTPMISKAKSDMFSARTFIDKDLIESEMKN
jgi:hypothetical protein